MGARSLKVLQVISGWQAVELILTCVFVGIWQIIEISVKRLWKGYRRKVDESQPVELTVDSSIGTHCYIKVMVSLFEFRTCFNIVFLLFLFVGCVLFFKLAVNAFGLIPITY